MCILQAGQQEGTLMNIRDLKNEFERIPVEMIKIVPHPEDENSKVVFYNSRNIMNASKEAMDDLYESICKNGLLQPIVCRVIPSKKDINIVDRFELIAGERRFRCILRALHENVKVYSSTTKSLVDAKDLYSAIPVKILFNCDDVKAIQINFSENEHSEPLTIMEEIQLVKRLMKIFDTEREVADVIGKSISWVSQTLNFEQALPADTFSLLNSNKIKRQVALELMRVPEEKRSEVFKKAKEKGKQEKQVKLEEATDKVIAAEVQLDSILASEELQKRKNNSYEVTKSVKKKQKALQEVEKAKKEVVKIEQSPEVKATHVELAAKEIGVDNNRKFSSKLFNDIFVKVVDEWFQQEDEIYDEELGFSYSKEDISFLHHITMCIVCGKTPQETMHEWHNKKG